MRYYFVNHMPCKSESEKVGCVEISKEHYDSLISAIDSFDLVAPEGKYYRLEVDGTWKLYDLPIIEEAESLQKQWEEETEKENE